MRNCTAIRSTDFEDMAGNTPWEADSLAHLAAHSPGEVQVLLAAAAAAAAAVAAVVAAAVGAQVNP